MMSTRPMTMPAVRKGLVEGLTVEESCDAYSDLVCSIAKRAYLRTGSRSILEYEDMVAWGYIGLIEAFDRFDEERGVRFPVFAAYRIRGSIYDQIRASDASLQRTSISAKDMQGAADLLTKKKQRKPSSLEMAKEMGLTLEKYWRLQKRREPKSHVSMELVDWKAGSHSFMETLPDDTPSIEQSIFAREFYSLVEEEISKLSEREQKVLHMRYQDEMKVSEIADVLGVTGPRVSQILSKARRCLKSRLTRHEH